MAHFAQLNDDSVVTSVIVVNNSELLDENGNESEQIGINFCKNLFNGTWVQTSYNNNFRKRYAQIGCKYDKNFDAFIPAKQYNSWIFNNQELDWNPPVEYPSDGNFYTWNENEIKWDKINDIN